MTKKYDFRGYILYIAVAYFIYQECEILLKKNDFIVYILYNPVANFIREKEREEGAEAGKSETMLVGIPREAGLRLKSIPDQSDNLKRRGEESVCYWLEKIVEYYPHVFLI